MGHIGGKFAEQDSYILTQQIQTSDNNQVAFNAILAENNHLRGSSAVFTAEAVNRTPGTPFPTVTAAGIGTVGAALGGIGQAGTPSENNDTDPSCFAYDTPIWMANNVVKPIGAIVVGKDYVKCFDAEGHLHNALVTDKFEHYRKECFMVKFADGRTTTTTKEHRYWTGDGFQPIEELDEVMHYHTDWQKVKILGKTVVTKSLVVFNITVDSFHTYFANNDACSNLKPSPGTGG